jgi:type II secretory pathway pseudopilin PulG
MAALFLLLAVLVGVVLVDAVLENTTAGTVTLFDRSFDQLSGGELLVVFAGLGFLLALFLFLAFGSSKSRRTRRRELRSARRDAESRVDDLEQENARLRDELARAGRVGRLADERNAATASPVGERQPAPGQPTGPPTGPPQPTSRRTERIDDRTVPPAQRPVEREPQRH